YASRVRHSSVRAEEHRAANGPAARDSIPLRFVPCRLAGRSSFLPVRQPLMEAVMWKHNSIKFAILGALLISIRWAAAQNSAASGLYQILSGTYTECCGIAGGFHFSLPSEGQTFVKLKFDSPGGLATMTFLGSDARTVFSVVPCPPANPNPINFNLGFGF